MKEGEKLMHALFDQWGELGMTRKLGGREASRRLVELCNIRAGQRVLDIGCGTGYTACLLAKDYQASVVTADINPKILNWAKSRIKKEGVEDKIEVMVADAQNLPFEDDSFNAVIAESVLVFCSQPKVASEVYRVLKPKGVFGDAEVTVQRPPSAFLRNLFSTPYPSLGLFNKQGEWEAIFKQAGFEMLSSKFYQINMFEQFIDLFQTDGVLRTISTIGKLIVNPKLRQPPGMSFKEGVKAWPEIRSIWGYGQYVAKKP